MAKQQEYAFVLDMDGKPLSPTKVEKAWYKIRKKQAVLVSNCILPQAVIQQISELIGR